MLKSLEKQNKLNRNQYLHLYVTPSVTPLFYGTIKLHKDGKPIRPIVSFCGSPTDLLSKFLTKILNPVTDKAPQKLKNSSSLKNDIQNLIIPSDHQMVSFDVKALYTSIPPT